MFFNNCNCTKPCCVKCVVQHEHDHRDCDRHDNYCDNDRDRGCGCKCCACQCCRQKQCCEVRRPQCPCREAQRSCGCGAYGNNNGWNNNGWGGNGGHGNGCGCSGNI
ncbi:MAG: hypothetical protein K2M48_01780 [Clostridiales bacterium]|nr:hypothetical protein [Clostridiales bacterium]